MGCGCRHVDTNYCAAVVVARSIWVMGGMRSATNKCLSSVETLNLDTMTWTSRPNMSELRSAPGAAVSDSYGSIYIFGGRSAKKKVSSTAEFFNMQTEQWTSIAPLPTRKGGCAAACLNNKMYVFGGQCGASYLRSGHLYDPQTDLWSILPPMAVGRAFSSSVVVEGFIYVIGGRQGRPALKSAEVFDSTNQAWRSITPMSTPRCGCGAVAVGNFIIVIGGFNGSQILSSAEIYNIEAQTWSPFPSLQHPRWGCSAVLSGNTIYVLGGSQGAPDVETMVLPTSLSLPPLQLPPLPSFQDRTIQLANLSRWLDSATVRKREFKNHVRALRDEARLRRESEVEIVEKEIQQLQAKVREIRSTTAGELAAINRKSKLLIQMADDQLQTAGEQIACLETSLHGSQRADPADPPRQLCCPITLELMSDPVVAADGHTYERAAIERVFSETTSPRSPITGAVLPSRSLFPNVAVRSMCREFGDDTSA